MIAALSPRARYTLVLLLLGTGWGSTQPLGKLAASTGHGAFGLIFWQQVTCVVVLGAISLFRGKGLHFRRQALAFYVIVALLGTIIPNATFYMSAARLPSGIMSLLISAIPFIALPLNLALGIEHFSRLKLVGLMLGLAGVALIALPGSSLPDPAMVAFLPLAMVGPLFYALENTFVARFGTMGMDPFEAMFGATLVGLILSVPLMLAFGHWFPMPLPPGRPEQALILSSALHALLYVTLVWLTTRTGAVFASQSSYVTTIAGLIWAMVLLGERFSLAVYGAAALLLLGVTLVRPRAS